MSIHRNALATKIHNALLDTGGGTASSIASKICRRVKHVDHRLKKMHAAGEIRRRRRRQTGFDHRAWWYELPKQAQT